MRRTLPFWMMVVTLAGGCGTPMRPADAPASATDPLDRRFRALGIARAEIALAILTEDAPRPGLPKPERVTDQVAEPMRASELARDRARAALDGKQANRAEEIERFADAVVRLEQHYLRARLYSTDPPKQGEFAPDDGRDVLGAPGVASKLRRWQADGFVKFVVPPPSADGRLEMRVGARATLHADIAAGPALAAGLIRFRFVGERAIASELENTSGGFRPGPLRNRTALAALIAAGAMPDSNDDLVIHHNPSGDYDRSQMAHP